MPPVAKVAFELPVFVGRHIVLMFWKWHSSTLPLAALFVDAFAHLYKYDNATDRPMTLNDSAKCIRDHADSGSVEVFCAFCLV
jgi:hypothetical protein